MSTSQASTSTNVPLIDAEMIDSGRRLEEISDAIDDFNASMAGAWDPLTETCDKNKSRDEYRNYDAATEKVKNFYKEQHEKQTVDFNIKARDNFYKRTPVRMSVWEAMELLNKVVDESDPDTSSSQIDHLIQTAEAIRRDGKPEWMQVAGLVHDLGKLLLVFGSEGQWDVVGDTFVVGCRYELDKIVYPETFNGNPDIKNDFYQSQFGIYKPHIGLDHVMLSWGHDEYLYHVLRDQCTLPAEALAMIRYHSFYPWHREGAYAHLCDEKDAEMLIAVKEFNPYDLYSKSDTQVDVETVRPYYENLIKKFFPPVVNW